MAALECSTADYKLEVSLAAEKIFSIGPLNVTNSMLTTVLWMALIFGFFFFLTRRLSIVPGRGQALVESIITPQFNLTRGTIGERGGRVFFPLIATIFIFIIFTNILSLLPGVGTVGLEHCVAVAKTGTDATALTPGGLAVLGEEYKANGRDLAAETPVQIVELEGTNEVEIQPLTSSGHSFDNDGAPVTVERGAVEAAKPGRVMVPFLRAPNADLNMTLAMALLTVVTSIVVGIRSHGVEFFKEFRNPMAFIEQFSRVLSLTFRLFGNTFAGEVLLAISLSLIFFSPVLSIFVGLEIFVAYIQALIFSLLALIFISLNYSEPGSHGGHGGEHHTPDPAHGDNTEYQAFSGDKTSGATQK